MERGWRSQPRSFLTHRSPSFNAGHFLNPFNKSFVRADNRFVHYSGRRQVHGKANLVQRDDPLNSRIGMRGMSALGRNFASSTFQASRQRNLLKRPMALEDVGHVANTDGRSRNGPLHLHAPGMPTDHTALLKKQRRRTAIHSGPVSGLSNISIPVLTNGLNEPLYLINAAQKNDYSLFLKTQRIRREWRQRHDTRDNRLAQKRSDQERFHSETHPAHTRHPLSTDPRLQTRQANTPSLVGSVPIKPQADIKLSRSGDVLRRAKSLPLHPYRQVDKARTSRQSAPLLRDAKVLSKASNHDRHVGKSTSLTHASPSSSVSSVKTFSARNHDRHVAIGQSTSLKRLPPSSSISAVKTLPVLKRSHSVTDIAIPPKPDVPNPTNKQYFNPSSKAVARPPAAPMPVSNKLHNPLFNNMSTTSVVNHTAPKLKHDHNLMTLVDEKGHPPNHGNSTRKKVEDLQMNDDVLILPIEEGGSIHKGVWHKRVKRTIPPFLLPSLANKTEKVADVKTGERNFYSRNRIVVPSMSENGGNGRNKVNPLGKPATATEFYQANTTSGL